MYKNLAATRVAACLLAFFAGFASAQSTPDAAPPLKAAFVYVTPVTDAGWVHQHELGRLALQKALGVQDAKNPAREAEAASLAWKPWRSYAVIRAWSAMPAKSIAPRGLKGKS